MKLSLFKTTAMLAITLGPSLLCAAPALAQQSQLQEVIVTARKRQESILNVPVVETALPKEQLERLQVKDVKDIANLVPGLQFGENFLSIGTQVSLRGVGTNAYDPGADQSVGLVLDGLQLANGLALMSGTFDMGQVEVLKGPQVLFYGKASTGGVISIRSADPTSTPEIVARAGYEVEARERRVELIASGPITDTLKGRLAGFWSEQDGFYHNIVAGPLPAFGGRLASKRLPEQKNWMIRGTVLWNPTSNFDARLKIANVHDRQNDQGALQLASCPNGTTGVTIAGTAQFLNPSDNCHIDRNVSWIEMDPRFFPNSLDNGQGFVETTQTYGTLELNYHVRPELTINSTTAYYLQHSHSDYEASSSWWGPGVEAINGFRRRTFTEELRVNSDFNGPLNFTAGGFLERSRLSDQVTLNGNTAPVLSVFGIPAGLAPTLQKGTNIVHIETESVFGQLRWKVIPQVEIAAGGRWTHEKRSDDPFLEFLTGVPAGSPILGFQVKPKPVIATSKFAPEVTITYKPTDDVTIFGSLKKASKAGGFHIGSPPDTTDNSFGEESVKGGELGLKSRWLDRALLFNLAGYHYKYSGLQVGAIVPVQGSSIPVTTVVNAGSSTVTGFEAEAAYRPPQVADLTLHADVTYNKTKYKDLFVPCFGGQSIEQGCNQVFSQNVNGGRGGFNDQSASGLPLVRAPKWEGHFGFDWQTRVGSDMTLVIANNQNVSSKYLTNLGKPYYQTSFIKSDLSLTLQGPKDEWEFALIGKNLNNSLTAGACTNFNGRGGLVISQTTGRPAGVGPAFSPGFPGEDQIGCIMDRGREVWFRVTYRPLS